MTPEIQLSPQFAAALNRPAPSRITIKLITMAATCMELGVGYPQWAAVEVAALSAEQLTRFNTWVVLETQLRKLQFDGE